jgi:hypothetical protein
MQRSAALLLDAFGRVHESVPRVVEGLTDEQLAWSPGPRANSIAWLVWHLARVEDDHVAGVAGSAQVWTSGGWLQRFGLGLDPRDIGYGHTTQQAHGVRAQAHLLTGYYDAVHGRTAGIVSGLTDADLDRIVDERWDPPVTAAVRLVSVVNDVTQHIGQAAYVRGLLADR